MSFIEFDDVYYTYPGGEKFALEGIILSVTEGEFLAVMGENGAGKTTFCKLINGIVPHLYGGRLSGTVTVDGCNTCAYSVPELAFKAGMVLDDPDAQLFASTVRHEAAFGPENMRLPPPEIEERIKFALGAVGLTGFEDRKPSALSGGEKQRLSIAASLAMKSKILVLDEPLCRLDPQGAAQVMSVLNDIRKNHGITIVMASHNSEMIAEYAGRVCILKNGRIAALDTVKNIFANRKLLIENGIKPLADSRRSYNEYFALFKRESFSITEKTQVSPVIEIKNLFFKYPNGSSIENINLSIFENDFIALAGNNGGGKTTLFKIITGLLRPSSGDVFIRGKNAKKLSVSEISKDIGFVMQSCDNQLFTDSVFKEVSFALKNMCLPKAEIKKRADEALAAAGLRDADAFPHALSRPDRVKTVIACVLAMGTRIILFDEIDAGNDYKSSMEIMNIAAKLHSKGCTVIFVTHNMDLASEYAKRLVKMERNGIVFDGRRNG